MTALVDTVKRSLADRTDVLAWRRVTMPGLDVPWAGVDVPSVETGGRPWVWEIVTPRQWERSDTLRADPMVLAVPQDVVVTEVHHRIFGSPLVRMQSPVAHAPTSLPLATGLDPDGPWSLRIETAWSVDALGHAAQSWIDRESPGVVLRTAGPSRAEGFELHPSMTIGSEAFDRLLTLHPDDAATATRLLSLVHDALAAFR